MKRNLIITVVGLVALLSSGWLLVRTAEQQTRKISTSPVAPLPIIPAKGSDATGKTVAAANDFLAELDETGRAKVNFAFNNDLKSRWSNFPVGVVPRNGIRWGDLNAIQRDAALKLLSTAFSTKGLQKVKEIMEADEAFKASSGSGGGFPGGGPPNGGRLPGGGPPDGQRQGGPPPNGPPNANNQTSNVPPGGRGGGRNGGGPGGPGGGTGPNFGRDNYYLAFFGTPSLTEPWMIQFGGHHLAINMTIGGKSNVLTPTLTGSQPATYKFDGETVRPLGQENDKGFELINSLDAEQQKQAILAYQVGDLILGPEEDGKTIEPEGIKVSALNAAQKEKLLDVVHEWIGIINDEAAAAKMAEIKANLAQTWFAWSGPTTKGSAAYFRIQGPTVFIEYSPQRARGSGLDTDHIHTIYRDPTNDYGARLASK